MRRFFAWLRSWLIVIAVAICFGAASGPAMARAAAYDLIICGSGGDEEYRAKFREWGRRLQEALVEVCGADPERVELMMEPGEGSGASPAATSLESIAARLEVLAGQVGSGDEVRLYLVGHGSYLAGETRFLIPGPDLTAAELSAMLEPVEAGRVVVFVLASSSAGFINELSALERVIVTATRTAGEREAVEITEHLIRALEEGSADLNRDERISVLELARQAAAMTALSYEQKGIIQTEHALIDDNGDGLGMRVLERDEVAALPSPEQRDERRDGALAERVFLRDFQFPEAAPPELVEHYLALIAQVEELRAGKAGLDESEYRSRLEALLVEAARAHREIRRFTPPEEQGGEAEDALPLKPKSDVSFTIP